MGFRAQRDTSVPNLGPSASEWPWENSGGNTRRRRRVEQALRWTDRLAELNLYFEERQKAKSAEKGGWGARKSPELMFVLHGLDLISDIYLINKINQKSRHE